MKTIKVILFICPLVAFLLISLITNTYSQDKNTKNNPNKIPKLSKESQACLDCHGDKDIEASTDEGKKLNLYIKPDALSGSIHEDLDCADCHIGADKDDEPHYDGVRRTLLGCDHCHEDAMEDYKTKDVHGKAYKTNKERAPWCNDCHGGHDILPLSSEESLLSHKNQLNTCGKCHGSEKFYTKGEISKRNLTERYMKSAHWEAVLGGKVAATCADCHSHHSILPTSDPQSTVAPLNLLKTCKKCHPNEVNAYKTGTHGMALIKGNHDVPTCITCHGDHDIISLGLQPDGKRNLSATQVCIWCHGNARMMERYSLDTSPVDSYLNNFHGLSQKGSSGRSATCADCHDAHDSLPESRPESTINKANRAATCGKCHGESSETFVMSFTHKKVTSVTGFKINEVVKIGYILLILITLIGILTHNAIIWSYSFRKKLQYQKYYGTITRMNHIERMWHFALIITFTMLGITGMLLKFPNSVIFSWLYSIGVTETLRAWLHRISAFLLVVSMIAFFIYQLKNKDFRIKWINGMIPRMRDLKELIENMKYYLGRTKARPKFAIFSYSEKFEYLALIWGTLIMTVTGLILLFPRSLPQSWPNWVFEVARTIHFLEAVLAISAIIAWHFFHAMFHPAEYPMDTSWLTGKITDEEAHHRFDEGTIKFMSKPEKETEKPEAPEIPGWAKADIDISKEKKKKKKQ